MEWFRNYKRYKRFLQRVRDNLPGHHPVSKIPFKWDIRIKSRKIYDAWLNEYKQIGLATLSIHQAPPLAKETIKDATVYRFSWFHKDIIPISFRKWRIRD